MEEEGVPDHRIISNLERVWWIRYSDGVTACCARSYRDAVEMAEAWGYWNRINICDFLGGAVDQFKIFDFPDNTSWLQGRMNGIGGSDASAIVGPESI